jgi:Cytochrome c7 and related cytochrome c
MAQIFHQSMNTVAKGSIFGAIFIIGFFSYVATVFNDSPYQTDQGIARAQPVPFSHKHHVLGLGIDCRYCHTSVETSHFAGLPPTKICMTCHSKIWTDAPILEPVRASWRENRPLSWTRVDILPGFVYFNHSIHINKGIGCATCHGPIQTMPLTYQYASLTMGFCLNCHRNPAKFIRPPSQVFNMEYKPPPDQLAFGEKLEKEEHVQVGQLTNCYICHR